MWFAVRDIRRSRVKFALFGAMVALVGALVLILTGLGQGLADASVSGLQRVPADAYVYQKDVRQFLSRSTVTLEQVSEAGDIDGVAASQPLGAFTASARRAPGAAPDDVALFGVDPGSTIPPAGVDLSTPGTGWADVALERAGVSVGDVLTVEPSKRTVRVLGFVDAGTYSHLPVVYVPLADWQAIKFGPVDGSGQVPAAASQLASAAVLTLDPGVTPADIADDVARAVDGVEVLTPAQAVAATPGYKEETGTVNLMIGFLYVIGALVVGTFFWTAAAGRVGEVAVLRAIGASTGRVMREHMAQVTVVSVVGLALAAVGSLLLARMLPTGVPFSLPASTVAVTSLVLLVVAVVAGLVPLRKLANVDPLLALGRNL